MELDPSAPKILSRENLENILESLPEKPPRSRLEPYSELILELRRRKRAYRAIVNVLAEKCNLRVSISTLHDFVHAKAKEAKRSAKIVRATARYSNDAAPASIRTSQLTEDQPADDEIRRRIAALKKRPIPLCASPDFEYNPDAPLRLSSGTGKPQGE